MASIRAVLQVFSFLGVALLLGACGGGSNGGPAATSSPPTLATSLTGTIEKDSATGAYRAALNAKVVLDASASRDPEGTALSFEWTLSDKPAGSKTALAQKGTGLVEFAADVLGTYVIQLKATDAGGVSTTQTVTIISDNQAPSTNVTTVVSLPGQSFNPTFVAALFDQVVMTAGGSPGTGATKINYFWSFVSKPTTSSAVLSAQGADNYYARFTPDSFGEYVIKAKVTDNLGAINESTITFNVNNARPYVYVQTYNTAPTAQVVPNFGVYPTGTTVKLKGGNSIDPDGDAITFVWEVLTKPTGSAVAVSSRTSADTNVTLDLSGYYSVRLQVTDSKGASADTVYSMSAGLDRPIVIVDRTRLLASVGAALSVSAASSYSYTGQPLSFQWTLDSSPAGSSASIASPTNAVLGFTPDVAGLYSFSVRATGVTASADASVIVDARSSLTGTVALNFVPVDAVYSRSTDLLVMSTRGPDALKIVEPGSGVIRTVLLPLAANKVSLSPNGLFAAVAHDAAISYVNLAQASVVRTVGTTANHSSLALTDRGLVYASGSTYSYSALLVDLNTGALIPPGTSFYYGSAFSTASTMLFADRMNRLFASNTSYSSIGNVQVDPSSGAITGSSSDISLNSSVYGSSMWLSEAQDLLFVGNGARYRTTNGTYAGTLPGVVSSPNYGTPAYLSMSSNTAKDELLAIQLALPAANTYPQVLPLGTVIQRYTGSFFTQATSLSAPSVASLQSYPLAVFHSGAGNMVLLVQTGTSTPRDSVASYYVVF